MALSVKYHNEMLPEGTEVDLGGFMVVNGGDAVELTKEHEAGIMSRTEMMPEDYFGESEDAEVTGTAFLTQADLDELVPLEEREDDTVVETAPVNEAAAAKEAAANQKAKEGGDTS